MTTTNTTEAPGQPAVMTLDDLPELATIAQMCDFTGLTRSTFARWAMDGKGPRVTKLGAAVRYRKADVIEWLDANRAK